MATRKRKTGRAGSWPLGLVGLLLLALAGFGVGLLAGVAWKEPGLVSSYVFGGTEEIAWGQAESAPDALPAVAAETPVEPADAPAVAPPPVAARSTALRPEVISPPGKSERMAVQVGAFAESASAERLAQTLRGKGFSVYVSPGTSAGQPRWRVRVGPLASREEAERAASRLKTVEKLPTWVLSEDGA